MTQPVIATPAPADAVQRTAPAQRSGPPVTPTSAEQEARRWRLIARLADAMTTAGPDCHRCATSAAELFSEELGDLAVVIILEPPGCHEPLVEMAQRDPASKALLDELLALATPDDLRLLCEDAAQAAAAAEATVTGAPATDEPGYYADAYQRYVDSFGLGEAAFAPLRREDTVLGVVICVRSPGSPSYTEADRSAIAAAADRISLLLDAMTARAAEQLTNRQSQVAFENSPIGMSVLSAAGRLRTVNAALCAILGRVPEEVVGRVWTEFTHPDDVNPESRMLEALLQGAARSAQTTKRMVRPDGELRWVELTTTLVPDDRGRPDAFHSQLLDVTDRVAAQTEAARFAALVHTSPDFVAITDLDGAVEFVNAAGRELIGMAPDLDVTRTTVADYLPAESRIQSEHIERATVLREGSWRGTTTLRDWRDDTAIPVAATSFLISDPVTGAPAALATVQRDIREQLAARLALEELADQQRMLLGELVRAEQAERRRIAADIHDESVQLLAAAQLRLQLLDAQLDQVGDSAARQSVANLRELVLGALQRLRQLLVELEPPGLLSENLAEAIRMVGRRLFDGTAVSVAVQGELTGLTPEVAAVLHRAAGEALSNARRHSGAHQVAVRLSQDAGAWRVRVEDDGIGIGAGPRERPGHIGIRGMTSRVEALGGICRVSARPEGGTAVDLVVPTPLERRPGRSGAL
jgi:PAS domain S-box-containing protein